MFNWVLGRDSNIIVGIIFYYPSSYHFKVSLTTHISQSEKTPWKKLPHEVFLEDLKEK